ncbi:MAG: DUF2752 domain-containing protein [Candidatus Sabulitectum sp.]|nr:DUF2752 domain-containing protein [Candidatus Sabulitectum sp.]
MRTYRVFNLVILGLLLYVLVYSLISPVLARQFPDLPGCYYKELTGDPCPFCGLTTDMNCLLTGEKDQARANSSFQLFLIVYVLEWIIRVAILLTSRRFTGKALPVIDIAIHCILAAKVLHTLSTV